MLRAAAALAIAAGLTVTACRREGDPGFEIVRVPLSAYATPDAGARRDAAAGQSDGGAGPLVVCVTPRDDDAAAEGDEGDDTDPSTDCPRRRDGRSYDPRVTNRHRDRGEEGVCCYRRGRLPDGDH